MKTYKLPTAGGRILNVFQDPDGEGFVFQTLTPAGAATYTQKGFQSEDILSNGMLDLLSNAEKVAVIEQIHATDWSKFDAEKAPNMSL